MSILDSERPICRTFTAVTPVRIRLWTPIETACYLRFLRIEARLYLALLDRRNGCEPLRMLFDISLIERGQHAQQALRRRSQEFADTRRHFRREPALLMQQLGNR